MKKFKSVPLKQVTIEDNFWSKRIELIREVVIPYQQKILHDQIPGIEPSHAIENFRIAAGESDGEFYGMVFQDSDVAKWLEAVAYALSTKPDPELEQAADDVIDIIAKAQQPDGYLNTYFTVAKPDQRWTNLAEDHELYCAGHMIEAAVAYYQATGKRKLLDVMCRYADYIDTVFGTEPGKKRGYPGHEEIELALIKLYRVTGEQKYLKLAKYFVDERGQEPNYFEQEYEQNKDKTHFKHPTDWDHSYNQSHQPVREQTTAEGHAVRAVYLYSAMADLALETGDDTLKAACETLWDNVVHKQMYVTAGIGSQAFQEGFSTDYDLPNDRAYTETCASIGLAFWAQRMLKLDPNRSYADILERALYNGILSGMSLDGKKFFYVNPLEVWPEACDVRHDKRHVKTARQDWFACACCPPNLARIIASLGEYIYTHNDQEVYVHLYMSGKAVVDVGQANLELTQTTNYPWDGEVNLSLSLKENQKITLALRMPAWCESPELTVNGAKVDLKSITENGYAKLTRVWSDGDRIQLQLPLTVKRIYPNPKVRMNAGKVALQRGPLVYCLEEVDNGPVLTDITLPKDEPLNAVFEPQLLGGVTAVTGDGYRSDIQEWQELYRTTDVGKQPVRIKAVPYFTWNNRGVGEMLVWIRE